MLHPTGFCLSDKRYSRRNIPGNTHKFLSSAFPNRVSVNILPIVQLYNLKHNCSSNRPLPHSVKDVYMKSQDMAVADRFQQMGESVFKKKTRRPNRKHLWTHRLLE